jgi:DEAD/DEAH box helicase domain-containing protein
VVPLSQAYPSLERNRPNHLVLFDARPGGTGVAEAAFVQGSWRLVEVALAMVADCSCSDGCPSCVHDPKCKEHNQVTSKRGAMILLQSVLNALRPSHADL